MGWRHIQGDRFDASVTQRENFKPVLLTERLKTAIKHINLDDKGLYQSRFELQREAQARGEKSLLDGIAIAILIRELTANLKGNAIPIGNRDRFTLATSTPCVTAAPTYPPA